MFSIPRALPSRTRTAAIAALTAVIACNLPSVADTSIKDAKIGRYVRWGAQKVNLRLDKVERVEHIDGRPIASDQNFNDTSNGYTIFSFSLQNAGEAEAAREVGISETFDDESEVDGHTSGPFVGSGRAAANLHLEHLQTVHIRMVQMNTPADRKITKIILDPNDGGAKLRYMIKDAEISRLTEVPLPTAAH